MPKHQSLTGLNLRVKASRAMHVLINNALVNKVIVHPHHDHETLADQAKQIGTTTRYRFKLIVKGAAQELHTSLSHARYAGDLIKGNFQHNIAMLTSRKLNEIADKIEKKANFTHAKTINITL